MSLLEAVWVKNRFKLFKTNVVVCLCSGSKENGGITEC